MEIDQDEAELLLKRARADLDKANAAIIELTRLQGQAAGLTRLIEGLELMHPALANAPAPTLPEVAAVRDQPDPEPPTAKMQVVRPATDSVRDILTEFPDRWFPSREMIKMFGERGLRATPTAIRLAMKRAAESGFAERKTTDDGGLIFRLRRQEEPLGSEEVSTS